MRRFLAIAGALLVAACATRPADVPDSTSRPDLREAARINTELGLNYMGKGDLGLAEEKLKRAVSEDSHSVAAYNGLGILYSRKQRDDEAEAAFKKALSFDSGNPDSLNNYGSFLCSRGKTDQAEEMFVKAATDTNYLRPELAWTNAGVCVRAKDPEKAEKYFREALKNNDKFPDALAQFAVLAYQRGDYLRARAFLQRYELVGPPTPNTLWLRARTEAALGDATTSRMYEQRLKTQFPEADLSDARPDALLK